MGTREQILADVRRLVDGRPVRWANPPLGDYDGCDRTLEIFNADAREQREIVGRLFKIRRDLARAAGGAVVFVFHTRRHSAELHSEFVRLSLQSEVEVDVATPVTPELLGASRIATSLSVDEGDHVLPREAA